MSCWKSGCSEARAIRQEGQLQRRVIRGHLAGGHPEDVGGTNAAREALRDKRVGEHAVDPRQERQKSVAVLGSLVARRDGFVEGIDNGADGFGFEARPIRPRDQAVLRRPRNN